MHHIKTKFINKDMTKDLSIVTMMIMSGDKKSMMNTEGTINVISKSFQTYFRHICFSYNVIGVYILLMYTFL